MKKELRDQIKQDELASGLEQAAAWAGSHAQQLRVGIGIGIVVLAAVGGLLYYRSQRALESERALREALVTFEAPVGPAQPGMQPAAAKTFATDQDKYKAAVAAFEGVEKKFGGSTAASRARYYDALSRIELGQYAEAEKALREIQSDGGIEGELARAALADVYRRSGQVDKAVEAYKGLATNPSANLPRDFALITAARTLEDAKRWAEARATYRQLYEEFPASVYASEARSRVQYLETAVQS